VAVKTHPKTITPTPAKHSRVQEQLKQASSLPKIVSIKEKEKEMSRKVAENLSLKIVLSHSDD